jgi:hypothetical protein
MNDIFIGIVENGKFMLLSPKAETSSDIRLTGIGMTAGVPPESAELNLTDYEGKAIAVRGHNGGDWIYSAAVIDVGGEIVTALAKDVFS